MKLSSVFLDGAIYVAIALFAFLQTQFGGDEAAKHISAQVLFWLKLHVGSFAACALALKMYRSTAYADSKSAQRSSDQKAADAKNGNGGAPPAPVPPTAPAQPDK
jgi:hypothetical protein